MIIINIDTLETWEKPKEQEIDYLLSSLRSRYFKVIETDNEILISGFMG